jgi:hypothetical protein
VFLLPGGSLLYGKDMKALLVPKFERAIHLTPTNMSEHVRLEWKLKKKMYLSCDKPRPIRVMAGVDEYGPDLYVTTETELFL